MSIGTIYILFLPFIETILFQVALYLKFKVVEINKQYYLLGHKRFIIDDLLKIFRFVIFNFGIGYKNAE